MMGNVVISRYGGGMMGPGMMYGSYGWWGFWMIIMALFWLAIFVALFLLIVWLYRRTFGVSGLAILKERYAKGQISKKEYWEMRKLLEKTGGGQHG
jgi:uncharacterized membrane protein